MSPLIPLGGNNLKDTITKRFQELVDQGQQLVGRMDKSDYYISEHNIPAFQAWLSSVSNILETASPPDSFFLNESKRLMTNEDMKHGISTNVASKMLGLLQSAQQEWVGGLLRRIEYILVAETFDNFLDHAAVYHKGNKKIEASVLASAVLEDTMKKISLKNELPSKGQALESLIDELSKAGAITPVKAKRMKAFSGIRNHALHAEFDDFDIKDVGEMIKGIRELIEDYL